MARWRKVLLAVGVFVVGLEVVLQIGALAMARFFTPAPSSAVRHASVLCIGDSYTFGMGATSPDFSYPGQLEALLKSRGIEGAVTNAGFPGLHSGDLLLALPSQLTPATKVLCVLVGTNDSWRHPPPVSAPVPDAVPPEDLADGRFVLTWRTGRLLALLLRFTANTWEKRGRDEAAAAPGADLGAAAKFRAAGFALFEAAGILQGPARRASHAPGIGGAPQQELEAFWQRMQAKDLQGGFTLATALAARCPESPPALLCLVDAAARTGQPAVGAEAVERLRRLRASRPSPAATECLAQALMTIGQPELAIEVARQRIAEDPLAVTAWDTLQTATFALGRRDESMRAMVETLSLIGRNNPHRSAFIARNYVRWLGKDDAEKIARILAGVMLLDGEVGEARLVVRKVKAVVARRQFEAAMAEAGAADGAAARSLAGILDEEYDGKGAGAWRDVLQNHLVAIGELARRRGIRMVVLGYPFQQEEAERAQVAAAQALGVPFVAIRERFDRELQTQPRATWFVADGHCNNAGYAIMAEMVAAVVGPMLAR